MPGERATAGPEGAPRRSLRWPSTRRRLFVVLGLSGFAISQPLLSTLGENPATVAFHGVDGRQLIAFALVVALVPPAVLWGVSAGAGRVHPPTGQALHLVTVAGLAGAALIQLLRLLGLEGVVLVVVGSTLGIVATLAYTRIAIVGLWASYTAILPALAVGAFLLTSPTSALLEARATPDRQSSQAPPVVVIVLDELPTRALVDRAGNLDATRFPTFASLLEDFTWYRHHTGMAPFTEVAVPSLLTGREPEDLPPVWTSHPDNLFTMLAPTHRLEVMEVATHLCPYADCPPAGASETGPGFGDLLDVTRDLWVDRVSPSGPGPVSLDDFAERVDSSAGRDGFIPGDGVMRSTSALADTFRASFRRAGSALYFLHLMLPHQPWRFRPDGSIYGDPDYLSLSLPEADQDVNRSWSEWDAVVFEQRLLLQTQHVDALLAQTLDDLRAQELYDDALVVITADHGISFEHRTPARELTEAKDTIDALAYTPLFVKLPHQADGGVDDANVMAIDVLPTIADHLGIEPGWSMDGAPIGSAEITGRGDTKVFLDMVGTDTGVEPRSLIRFHDREQWPTVPDRLLDPLPDPDDPLSALAGLLPIVTGTPLAELPSAGGGGSLRIMGLDQLEHPVDAPYGIVLGVVADPPSEGVALLAIDDVVVAASPLSTDSAGLSGRVTFIVPEGVLDDDNDVRAALLVGDGRALELTVTGG